MDTATMLANSMMRVRLVVPLLIVSISVPAAAFLLTGCHGKAVQAPVPAGQARADAIKAANGHPAAYYNGIKDELLLDQHTERGLELALKMDADHYANAEPITFHVLVEDKAAGIPIAGGLCSGLSLAWQNLDDGTAGTAGIDVPHCFATIPSPDEIPLVRDKVKRVDVTQQEASHTAFAPGTYLINLSWSAYAAGRGTIAGRQTYATLKSNVVLFTVTP